MSVLAVPIALAPVLGPAFGGLLIEAASWRWIFLINVPVGAVAFLLGARRLPRTPTEPAGLGSTCPASACSRSACRGSSTASRLGQGRGGDPQHVLLPLVGGLLLVAVFVRHALRAERPSCSTSACSRSGAFAAAAAATFVSVPRSSARCCSCRSSSRPCTARAPP